MSVFAGGLAELLPGGAVIGGDVPVTIDYVELGGGGAFTGEAGDAELVALGVKEPVAVECPVVNAVGVLLDADLGADAVLYSYGGAFGEVDGVGAVFLFDGSDGELLAEGLYERCEVADVGVGGAHLLLEGAYAVLELVDLALEE